MVIKIKKIIFSQKEIQDIINLYLKENYSLKKIGDKYNVSRSVIKRVLEENQIKLREKTHKISCDYDIFETVDNELKAYWLGFLMADGCNYQREQNSTIIITLSNKDKNHLEKFKKFCKLDKEIKTFVANSGFSNNNEMCRIEIYSNKMSKDLADKGMVPKKSLILNKPKINEKYYLPFILGYFDGDGSIFKTKQGNYGINIEGTKEILEWINNILNISDNYEKRYDDNKNNYYIRCGGTNKPYQIMKKLYDSCPEHLDRKFNIYKELETVVLNGNIK